MFVLVESPEGGTGVFLRKFFEAGNAAVDIAFFKLPARYGKGYLFGSQVAAGHLQILARRNARGAVVSSHPVGHDYALKAPFAAQDIGYQPPVFRAVCAVYFVVRRHHRRSLAALYRRLERSNVHLAQGAPGDFCGIHGARPLAAVAGKVLYARRHALALHAAYILRRELARKVWFLRKVFKISAAQRIALYIHAGA